MIKMSQNSPNNNNGNEDDQEALDAIISELEEIFPSAARPKPETELDRELKEDNNESVSHDSHDHEEVGTEKNEVDLAPSHQNRLKKKYKSLQLWWDRIFRNKIAGIIFGRYSLEKVAENYLSEKETFINGIEIIFWGEEIYLATFFLVVATFAFGFVINPLIILLPFIFVPVLLYFATELQIVLVTDERIIIEKRGIIEKLTRTQQFQGINLDQIAMLSYARSPPNIALLLVSLLGLLLDVTAITYEIIDFKVFTSIFDLSIFIFVFLGFFALIYLVWFSLRLTKRSIEVFVIGITKPMGIGRVKGAPVWFLSELQATITERIHHTFHSEKTDKDKFELEVAEYPLQYSSIVKDIIKETGASLAKALILQIDREYIDMEALYATLPHYTTTHIENELSFLKSKTILIYNPDNDQWEINKKYKRKFIHEESQKKL